MEHNVGIKRYKKITLLGIAIIALGFSLLYTYKWYKLKKLDSGLQVLIDARTKCFTLFEKCPYFHPSWDAPFINVNRDSDLQLLKKYEEAYELCIKPMDSLRKSYNENFQNCLKNSIYFNKKIYEMDMAIYSGFNQYKVIVEKRKDDLIKFFDSFDPNNKEHIQTIEKNSELILYLNIDVPEHIIEYVSYGFNGKRLKPHPKPLPSFLAGKTDSEIFSLYKSFVYKFNVNNEEHIAQLKKWTEDRLFRELKTKDEWMEKIEELDHMILSTLISDQ